MAGPPSGVKVMSLMEMSSRHSVRDSQTADVAREKRNDQRLLRPLDRAIQ